MNISKAGEMLRITRWQLLVGVTLILMSFGLGLIHILIFHDIRNLLFYLFLDLVYLPIEVLLVTLIIQGWLNTREKRVMMEKLNMVIEIFFSEMGTTLMKMMFDFLKDFEADRVKYLQLQTWDDRQFEKVKKEIRSNVYPIDCHQGRLDELRVYLISKRDFSLRLLENPNLLEHETFTDLLWAVFHLTEELSHRLECSLLGDPDRNHLANDIQRAYNLLVYEWLGYMQHLKNNYPFLFSLASRLNPFDPQASAEIKYEI